MITDDRSFSKNETKKKAEKIFLSADEKVGKYNTKNGEEKDGTYDNLDGKLRRSKDRMFDQYEEKAVESENRNMESKENIRNEEYENIQINEIRDVKRNEKRNERSSEKRDERRKNKIDNDISDNIDIITAIMSRLNVVESQAKRTR
jgi:hypothetical protein